MQGHNKAFAADPFAYVQRYAINHLAMKVSGEKDASDFDEVPRYDERGRIQPGAYSGYSNAVNQAKGAIELAKQGQFDLEPVVLEGRTVIYLRFVVPGRYAPAMEYGGSARGADPAFGAHWLGYVMPGVQGTDKARIPFVDVLKAGPAYTLVLTGAMNGCSMVVTQKPGDPTMLRVYHDSAHGTHTFANDVVHARIDYTDEGYASANKTAPMLAPRAGPGRTRSASLGAMPAGGPVRPAGFVRHSYGDLATYQAMATSAGGVAKGTEVRLVTSFNFLYFDPATSRWIAVSQPLETMPGVAQPAKAWYEGDEAFAKRKKAHIKRGTQVALPPSRPPWTAAIPY